MFGKLNRGISTMIGLMIIIAVAIVATGGILAYQNGWVAKLIPQKPVACTMEAKVCPDGSAVGRIGPNCEFAQCSATKTDETAGWKIYRDEEIGIEFRYPEDLWGPLDVEIRKSGEEGITSGKEKLVGFSPKNGPYSVFWAQTADYKNPFVVRDFSSVSKCSIPIVYNEKGNGCKQIEIGGQKAVFANELSDVEGGLVFNSQVYFDNPTESIYKNLIFTLILNDVGTKINEISSELQQKIYSESLSQSKNIMENKNLSDKDKKGLEIFNNIISTFKFTK